ncbi:hypothetical protein [Ralstonia holmesii]|uniref:hypothetical protein n=1 Tax=Ralstonia holmesii TaxID=3058602 RepID=UPI003F172137
MTTLDELQGLLSAQCPNDSAATVAEPSDDEAGKFKAQTTITLRQAEALLAFFGGHDSEVALASHDGGLIAWGTECPEEGSFWLGKTEVDDALAMNGRPQAAQQQAEPVGDEREDEAPFDFHRALQIANGVMEQYKSDQPRWWKRMDGTPILNDLPVIMALAFQAECEALQERAIKAEALNRKFADSINGPTHMGEPVIPEDDTSFVPDYKALWAFGMLSNQLEERGENERAAEIRALINRVTGKACASALQAEPVGVGPTVTAQGMKWLRNAYPQLVKGMEERGLIAAQSGQRAGVADWVDAAVQDPPDATPVLVSGFEYNNPRYPRYYDVCRFEDGAWVSDANGDTVFTPTHWMTIAAAPTPAAQGGDSHD